MPVAPGGLWHPRLPLCESERFLTTTTQRHEEHLITQPLLCFLLLLCGWFFLSSLPASRFNARSPGVMVNCFSPYPRSPLREFTPCAPGRSAPTPRLQPRAAQNPRAPRFSQGGGEQRGGAGEAQNKCYKKAAGKMTDGP